MMDSPLSSRPLRVGIAVTALAFCSLGANASAQDTVPDGFQAVFSKMKIKVYGKIKADVSYDQSETNNGEFVGWLTEGGDGDGQFNMTARETRLGLDVEGPSADGITTSARVEVDFFSGGVENAATPRLRHGFVNVDWTEHDFSLLVGQTSDVISPLVPSTVNYPVAWWVGDIGYRRAQVRATKGFNVNEDVRLVAQAAAVRSIGGEDAGRPGYQGRVAATFPGIGSRKTTLGVGVADAPEAGNTDASAVAVDLVLPIADGTTLKTEFYSGDNVDAFLGGIGQGVNAAGDEIGSSGWWAAVTHTLNSKNKLNVGFSQDSPDSGDLDAGARETNSRVWANVFHNLNSSTVVGLEVAHSETDYKGGDSSDGLRVQGTVIIFL